jgi:hypothetical protein
MSWLSPESLGKSGPSSSKTRRKRNKAGKVARRATLPETTLNLSLEGVFLTRKHLLVVGTEKKGKLLRGSLREGVCRRGRRAKLLRETTSTSLRASSLITSSRTS